MPIHKNYNRTFFKHWSADMAYVLGFLFADGNIIKTKRDTHFVAFHSADRESLLHIKHVLNAEHVLSRRAAASGNVYRLQIGSKEWFDDLVSVGLTPTKSQRMSIPKIPRKYIGDFVRGYFDGDGNIWTNMNIVESRPKKGSISCLVSFTSASHDFLNGLLNTLRSEGVAGGSLFRAKKGTFSRLNFSKRDALKIYKIMYNAPHNLYLKRKKDVFDRFVKLQR